MLQHQSTLLGRSTSHLSSDRGETPGVYADVTKALRFIDWAAKSIEKPDPCNPSPCESGTMCMTNKFGNPIYRCLGKFVPKPDTITGRLIVFRPKTKHVESEHIHFSSPCTNSSVFFVNNHWNILRNHIRYVQY